MNPFAGIALVLAALGALVFVVKALQAAGAVGGELARKLVHMGMGVVCLTFPWIFTSPWPVWALAALACVALAGLRLVPAVRARFGAVLHAVERFSLGELYFPLGVAAVFTLARGDALRYGVPIAILTFADAAGALVGKRFGRHFFDTLEGRKSVEGSSAVALATFVCAAVPLLATGHDVAHACLLGAILGLFALMVEAISWHGLDNIFLPLAAFAQLGANLDETPLRLAGQLGVLVALLALAIVWRRGDLIDHSARLGAALALFFFWSVGSWRWLVAPVILLASYVRLMPAIPGGVPRHNLLAVLCVGSAALPWAVAHAVWPAENWLWPFTLGLATQQAIIATVRYSQAWPAWSRVACAAVGGGQAIALQLLAGWAITRSARDDAIALFGAITLAGALIAFVLCEPHLQRPSDLGARWWKQGLTALAAGGIAASSPIFL